MDTFLLLLFFGSPVLTAIAYGIFGSRIAAYARLHEKEWVRRVRRIIAGVIVAALGVSCLLHLVVLPSIDSRLSSDARLNNSLYSFQLTISYPEYLVYADKGGYFSVQSKYGAAAFMIFLSLAIALMNVLSKAFGADRYLGLLFLFALAGILPMMLSFVPALGSVNNQLLVNRATTFKPLVASMSTISPQETESLDNAEPQPSKVLIVDRTGRIELPQTSSDNWPRNLAEVDCVVRQYWYEDRDPSTKWNVYSVDPITRQKTFLRNEYTNATGWHYGLYDLRTRKWYALGTSLEKGMKELEEKGYVHGVSN